MFGMPMVTTSSAHLASISMVALMGEYALMPWTCKESVDITALWTCCSYSRKIMWMNLASTNKDPEVVVKYYLDVVESIGGSCSDGFVNSNC